MNSLQSNELREMSIAIDALMSALEGIKNCRKWKRLQRVKDPDSDYGGDIESAGEESHSQEEEEDEEVVVVVQPIKTHPPVILDLRRKKTGIWYAWDKTQELRAPVIPGVLRGDTGSSSSRISKESRPPIILRLGKNRKRSGAHGTDTAATSDSTPSLQLKRLAEEPTVDGSILSQEPETATPPGTPARRSTSGQTWPIRCSPARKAKDRSQVRFGYRSLEPDRHTTEHECDAGRRGGGGLATLFGGD